MESVFGRLTRKKVSVDVRAEWKLEKSVKDGDVRLVSVGTYEAVFHEVLSCFVQFSVLPERRTLLLCREETQWEDLMLLLLRWRLSRGSADGEELFCIANAELLTNTLQVQCVTFVQDSLSPHRPPLLFVCGPSKTSYLVSQFANRRLPAHNIDLAILQEVVKMSFHEKVRTFVSKHAGAGKSFEIKRSTSRLDHNGGSSRRMYLRIPAASIPHFRMLFSMRTEVILMEVEASVCLHVDIGETVGAEFNSYLFEVMFFGGYADLSRGSVAFFPVNRTSLAIELPSGSLKKHLVAAHLCPQHFVEARADTFCSKRSDLRRGMGKYLFYGKRYDGSSMRKQQECVTPANAFERLQYVCVDVENS
jgi:hypothetical protein